MGKRAVSVQALSIQFVLVFLLLSGCLAGKNLTGIVAGTQEYAREDYRKAIPRFKLALLRDPADQTALSLLAWSYYNLEDYKKAEEAFLQYGRRYPAEPEVYKGLAWCYYQMREFSRSVGEYRKWLSVEPTSKEAHEGLAASYIELGEDTAALKQLQPYYEVGEMTRKFPQWPYPYLLLGQRELAKKNYNAAYRFFQSVRKLKPDSPSARKGTREIITLGKKRIQLARDYHHKKRLKVAVRYYSQTASAFPFWAEPYIGMGQCYLAMDRYDDAEASFRQALYLNPESKKARQGIRDTINQRDPTLRAAWKDLKASRYLDAAALFETVTQGPGLFNIPEDERWVLYRGLGWSYFHLSNMEGARSNFQKALRLKANDPKSLKGLGLTYFREKKYGPAKMFLDMAAKSLEKDTELWATLGWAYYRTNQFKKAMEKFESALSLDSGHLNARKGLAWASYRAGDLPGARIEFQDLLQRNADYIKDKKFQGLILKNPQWWKFSNRLGWSRYQDKDLAAAATAFLSSLEQAPNNPDAVEGMGFIHFSQKNYTEAIQGLKAVVAENKGTAPVLEQDFMNYKNRVSNNARSKLAWSYFLTGKFPKAALEFQRVVRENPEWTNSLYGLALSLQKLKKYDEAEKNYKAILAKNSGQLWALDGIHAIQQLRKEEQKRIEEEKKKAEAEKKKKRRARKKRHKKRPAVKKKGT